MDEQVDPLDAHSIPPNETSNPNTDQPATRQGEQQFPIPDVLPILPVRRLVMFPGGALPLLGKSAT